MESMCLIRLHSIATITMGPSRVTRAVFTRDQMEANGLKRGGT